MTGIGSWVEQAACAGLPTDEFFPSSDEEAGTAKAVCSTCEVALECLEYALASDVTGVFGGTTARDRTLIRNRRGSLLQCPHCPARYISRQAVASHVKHRHGRLNERCDDCGSAYSSPETLAYHRKTKHKEAS